MDSIREQLKMSILEEVYCLTGKTWISPAGERLPYLSKRGVLLCPLALAMEGREEAATDMHELIPWPFGTMARKYTPGKLNAKSTIDAYTAQARISAYYVKPLVILISNRTNTTIADGPEARAVGGYYNQCKYGTAAYAEAIVNLGALVRVPLSIQVEEINQ